MIKAIIFDYDGVIVDSFQNVFEVYQAICKELGKKCPATLEEFRKIYGRTYLDCYHNLGINPDEYEKAEQVFKREILKKTPKLFDGIKEVIVQLSKKYKLILVSATYKAEVAQKLENFEIIKYFSHIIGQLHETDKPISKAKEITQVLKKEGLAKDEVVLIGDRNVDFDAGKKAGLKNIILVEYGWGYHKETLPHQEVIVNQPKDLLRAISVIDFSL